MPPKKKAAKAKAPAADRKYSYLPRDLQRAAQHMDRVAFIRQLQRSQADRQYKHVTTQTGSELSSTGAVDLAGKIDLLRSEVASAIGGVRTDMRMAADRAGRARSVPPFPGTAEAQRIAVERQAAADRARLARSVPKQPPTKRPGDEPEFTGAYSLGGSSGSGYR